MRHLDRKELWMQSHDVQAVRYALLLLVRQSDFESESVSAFQQPQLRVLSKTVRWLVG